MLQGNHPAKYNIPAGGTDFGPFVKFKPWMTSLMVLSGVLVLKTGAVISNCGLSISKGLVYIFTQHHWSTTDQFADCSNIPGSFFWVCQNRYVGAPGSPKPGTDYPAEWVHQAWIEQLWSSYWSLHWLSSSWYHEWRRIQWIWMRTHNSFPRLYHLRCNKYPCLRLCPA